MEDILSYQFKPEDDYYFILGVDELSSIEQINAEYKLKALKCHPDKNPDVQSAVERFSRLQKAKQTLSDPASREQYDIWRRSGIAIPYEAWCAKRNVHTSMHWASRKKKEPMLMNQSEDSSIQQKDDRWRGDDTWADNDDIILKKFRNYEI
ncbi:DnaJ-like subfamily C member 12 [Lamellibrachia satsuma]|nr:DnaJ-like subfamily C member 12 [Lamellibrachia satsuma]